MKDGSRQAAHGTGPWTKLAIGGQVVAVVLLAGAAAALLTWLAARPGLRQRFDLTAEATNTLDPALGDLVQKLPGRATIDVFFRAQPAPLTRASLDAQSRTSDLLAVARSQFPDKLTVIYHDLGDAAAAGARMRELEVEEDNVIVVQAGERRAVLKLWRDLARLDPGNPEMRTEPSLESFRGEQALANALLEVTAGEGAEVVFVTGQGERDVRDSESPGAVGRLRSALSADGLRVSVWNAAEETLLPPRARVAVLLDPKQPLRAEAFDSLVQFVERGGRLLVVPASDDAAFDKELGAEKLLRRFGVLTAGGFVAAPYADRFGRPQDGDERCSVVWIEPQGFDPRHPITESLFRAKRSAVFVKSRVFARTSETPKNSVMPDVVRTPLLTWRDLSAATIPPDWKRDPKLEPETGPFSVCLAGAFPAPAAVASDGEPPVSKLVALGSAEVLANAQFDTNRDLALNLFNWLASRDERLVVRPRVIDRRELDLREPRNASTLLAFSVIGLPALCAALGLVVAWRRRK